MIKNIQIAGTGYYVPEKIVTNDDLASYLDTSDEWIKTKVGIKERRVADDTMVTSDLAALAAKQAMKNAAIDADDIDMIILATNMPDHISPACAVQVQKKTGAYKAVAFDIRTGGCTGLLHGISIGSKFIYDNTCRTVLVVAADLNSRKINWDDRLTAVIFGDGASAVVLKKHTEGKLFQTQLFSNPDGYYDISVPDGYYGAYVPGGGIAEPLTHESLDRGRQYLELNGRAIFDFATTVFPESVKNIVRDNNMELNQVDLIISHQANINIIKSSMEKLNLPMEKTYCNVDRYGNTGGASIGIAFSEAIEKRLVKRGDKIVFVAYGAGFSWAAALFEY